MTLSAYLLKHKITSQQFAKTVRVSVSSVDKWRMPNFRVPRRATILKIEKATRGSVRAKDWYN